MPRTRGVTTRGATAGLKSLMVPAYSSVMPDSNRTGSGEYPTVLSMLPQAGELGVEAITAKLVSLFQSQEYEPPLLPGVVLELMTLSWKPDVTAQEIVVVLSRDPMLASQLLKLSQSPLYRGAQVRSLHDAVVRLGLRRVSDLFCRAALEMRVFRAPGYENDMARLRTHSAFTAELTRLICRETEVPNDYAFLCGLLHDVGIAACIIALNEVAQSGPGVTLDAAWPAVRELHEWASEFLAKTWAFPPDLVRVLASHHGGDDDPADRQVLAALRIADALAEEVGYGFHAEIPEGQLKKAVQVLGLDLIRLEKLRDTAKELAEAFSH
jgi:HD-like signal output (HDOD) protein